MRLMFEFRLRLWVSLQVCLTLNVLFLVQYFDSYDVCGFLFFSQQRLLDAANPFWTEELSSESFHSLLNALCRISYRGDQIKERTWQTSPIQKDKNKLNKFLENQSHPPKSAQTQHSCWGVTSSLEWFIWPPSLKPETRAVVPASRAAEWHGHWRHFIGLQFL